MGQQPRGGDALVDDVRRHLLLGDALALATQPAAPQVALDREDAGHVFEFLGGVLADAFEPAAARAVQVFGIMTDLDARQRLRQRQTPGLACSRGLFRGDDAVELGLNGRCIGQSVFLEEAELGGVELLADAPEANPAQITQLELELVDQDVARADLFVFCANLLVAHVQLLHQLGSQAAQLMLIKTCKIGDIVHARQCARNRGRAYCRAVLTV